MPMEANKHLITWRYGQLELSMPMEANKHLITFSDSFFHPFHVPFLQ